MHNSFRRVFASGEGGGTGNGARKEIKGDLNKIYDVFFL